ncbi:MAG: biopolymer transport protein ExbD [Campylobacterota bacterium]|nr:biopolymer transport protein ExbD [Campylobacterota bacterium]
MTFEDFSWDEKPDLNITPLVDVMLVLIAILMLTTPMLVYEEKISLAKGSAKVRYEKANSIEIRVDRKKNVYIDKNKYNFNSFPDSFIMMANSYPSKNNKIMIRADRGLKYEDVIFILKSVKAAGFTNVSLVTDG